MSLLPTDDWPIVRVWGAGDDAIRLRPGRKKALPVASSFEMCPPDCIERRRAPWKLYMKVEGDEWAKAKPVLKTYRRKHKLKGQ